MAQIFLNYRIDDSSYAAAGIYTTLAGIFGEDEVFRDCDSVLPGQDYPPSIMDALKRCGVLVTLIGATWLDLTDQSGARRLDNTNDWVRREIRWAIQHGVPIVPVLLDDVKMPPADLLPSDIRTLSFIQACWVRHHQFQRDVAELADRLAQLVAGLRPVVPPGGARTGSTQHNVASGNGIVFANQDGDQTVHNHTFAHPRGRR
jgi:TIR domain